MSVEPTLRDVLQEREPHVTSNPRPHAYASDAGKCLRQVAYNVALARGEQSDEGEGFSLASLIAFTIGDHLHKVVQRALAAKYPDFVEETRWSFRGVSGRADGVYSIGDTRLVVEIKTTSDWAFARATKGTKNVEAVGPSPEHLLQAMLSALAMDAHRVHIIYINKSSRAGQPPMAEWFYDLDVPAALAEFARLQAAVDMARAGVLPAPEYLGQVIPDPELEKWPCAYCPFRQHCAMAGPAEQPLSVLE